MQSQNVLRKESINWWNTLSTDVFVKLNKQSELIRKHYDMVRIPSSMTGREIESIYLKEFPDKRVFMPVD